ncbi:MAG: hypothetical protein L6R42_008326, partial [Xanthoria sp. 1 TBL-2021]
AGVVAELGLDGLRNRLQGLDEPIVGDELSVDIQAIMGPVDEVEDRLLLTDDCSHIELVDVEVLVMMLVVEVANGSRRGIECKVPSTKSATTVTTTSVPLLLDESGKVPSGLGQKQLRLDEKLLAAVAQKLSCSIWSYYEQISGDSTQYKSSPDSSRYPTVPPTSKASPNSNGSSKKPTILSGPSNLFFPASESPKCLSFLEPPSVTSTPRKSYSRLPSNNPRKSSVPCLEIAPTPVVRYRRLRKLFLVSAFLLFLVSALYVLEGFAIAAAQDYAHVRVLSHANGKGGLGKGKENEKWLIPWSVYLVIEGGLMLWAVWMVNGSRRMARKSALDRDGRKEDDNKRPREDGSGDIELQDFGNDEEEETFLTANQTGHEDVFRDELNGRANNTMDEEEEKEWKALGFYRTSECPEERISPANSHKPKLVSALQQDTHFVSPNGEGSSSGPSYSDGSGFDGYMDESGIPLPDLPGAVKQWQAERSFAEMKLQRRGSDTREFGPDPDPEESSSITQDQDTLLQVEPRGTPRKDLRNSWQQGDDTKQNPEQQSK